MHTCTEFRQILFISITEIKFSKFYVSNKCFLQKIFHPHIYTSVPTNNEICGHVTAFGIISEYALYRASIFDFAKYAKGGLCGNVMTIVSAPRGHSMDIKIAQNIATHLLVSRLRYDREDLACSSGIIPSLLALSRLDGSSRNLVVLNYNQAWPVSGGG